MRLLHLMSAALFILVAFPAAAGHVDPYKVMEEAAQAYGKSERYADARAVLSKALREAAHAGSLDPVYAILYAMYADTARFDGNPSFALQLTDEGLALALSAPEPDTDVKNMLLVSRAYALADLGRYAEAIGTVRITALWMGERFGAEHRKELEDEAAVWAQKLAGDDPNVAGAPVVELAVTLLDQAREALDAYDTARAIMLASRAILPDGTAVGGTEVLSINARAQTLVGVAYGIEGRPAAAVTALRRVAEILCAGPWDGKRPAALLPAVRENPAIRDVAWDSFSYLASNAVAVGEPDLALAALATVEDLADNPARRFALMVQRAGVIFSRKDYREAERIFVATGRDAEAVGDRLNASLADFYLAIARLYLAAGDDVATAREALVTAARRAADIAGSDLQMRQYVLTTATRMLFMRSFDHMDALPLAEPAFQAFKARQAALGGYDSGQEAARRDQRSFLDIYVGANYAAARAK
ncbi:MAG TPA: hypothetical protein GX405_07695 [Rhizobiales bacterium]|nr:hypothetical protein [Hyphomicrobiales bacterium]